MKRSLLVALEIASHLAYMVILPLTILGGLGLLIDRALGTLPLALFIGIGLAFVATIFWVKNKLRLIIEQKLK